MSFKSLEKVSAMSNGRATKVVSRLESQCFENSDSEVNYNDNAMIMRSTIDGVDVRLTDQKQGYASMNPSTAKLYYAGNACFVGNAENDCTVSFSEIEFYRLNGWAVDPVPDENGIVTEHEKNRAANAFRKAKKTTRENLELLYNISFSWKETLKKGKNGKPIDVNFRDVRLLQEKGIAHGVITMVFSQRYANYLRNLPLTAFRPEILQINAKKPNTLRMALKLTDLWYNKLAIEQKHNDIISVKTLLSVTDFPDLETLSANKKNWKTSVKGGLKIPFESALNELLELGLLKHWEYKGSSDFENYYDWEQAVIKFKINPNTSISS